MFQSVYFSFDRTRKVALIKHGDIIGGRIHLHREFCFDRDHAVNKSGKLNGLSDYAQIAFPDSNGYFVFGYHNARRGKIKPRRRFGGKGSHEILGIIFGCRRRKTQTESYIFVCVFGDTLENYITVEKHF